MTFSLITVADIGVSHAEAVEDRGCPILFDEDITSNFTRVAEGHVGQVTIFPDSKSSMHLLRVSHAGVTNPYEIEIVGMNLICSPGLVDVFLQAIDQETDPYWECVRGRVYSPTDGTTHCAFRCLPMSTGKTTFVRFAKVNYVATNYDQWTLNDIRIEGRI